MMSESAAMEETSSKRLFNRWVYDFPPLRSENETVKYREGAFPRSNFKRGSASLCDDVMDKPFTGG